MGIYHSKEGSKTQTFGEEHRSIAALEIPN